MSAKEFLRFKGQLRVYINDQTWSLIFKTFYQSLYLDKTLILRNKKSLAKQHSSTFSDYIVHV